MVYTISTTELKPLTINYLYWEYETEEEILDINFEELEENYTINITEDAII
jgi:hypothetical protein